MGGERQHWGLEQHCGSNQEKKPPPFPRGNTEPTTQAGSGACSSCQGWWSDWGWVSCHPKYGYSLGCCAGDTGPKRLSGCSDQRGSLDSVLKVCGSMRGSQSNGIYSQDSPALNPTWHCPGCTSTLAGQSPLEQEQSIAKDNLGEGWLNDPLPCPAGCPSILDSRTFLTSKISAHMIFSIWRPQLAEAQHMCPGCFTSQNRHTCWVYIFNLLRK